GRRDRTAWQRAPGRSGCKCESIPRAEADGPTYRNTEAKTKEVPTMSCNGLSTVAVRTISVCPSFVRPVFLRTIAVKPVFVRRIAVRPVCVRALAVKPDVVRGTAGRPGAGRATPRP